MKVIGPLYRVVDSDRIVVQPLFKEVIAMVFDLCCGSAKVFVHRAIVAHVQHCVWLLASEWTIIVRQPSDEDLKEI